jgi:hypothetical protein
MPLAFSTCEAALASDVRLRCYKRFTCVDVEINTREMTDSNSFTVTLPSNSNMKTHPHNHGHNYVVKPAMSINLTDHTLNSDSRWEVALTALQYTNHFYQLREDVTIYAVVIVPDLESFQINAQFGKTVQLDVDFTENDRAIRSMSTTVRRILKPFVKDSSNATEKWFVVLGQFTIPAGEYKSPLALAKLLTQRFNAVFNNARYQYRMQVELTEPAGTLHFTAVSRLGKYKFFLYTENVNISPALGSVLISIDDLEPPINFISPLSNSTPSFNTVHSLYVYSDIVDEQRVGDESSRLMDIVPVQGAPGQRVHYEFDPPTYLPVCRNFIETINITIKDGDGGVVLFPDSDDNVVCRLHFRRVYKGFI